MILKGLSSLEVSMRHRNGLGVVDFSPNMCAFLSRQHLANPHLLAKRFLCRPDVSCSSNLTTGPHSRGKFCSSRNALPFLRWNSLHTGLMSSGRIARFNPSPSNVVTHSIVHGEFSEITTLSEASHPPVQPEEIVKLFFFLTDHVKDVNVNAVISFAVAIALVLGSATYVLKQQRQSNSQQIRESSSPSSSKVAENNQLSNSQQSRERISLGPSKIAENDNPNIAEDKLSNVLLENDDWLNFSKLSPFNRTVAARCPSLRFAAADTYVQRGDFNKVQDQRRCLLATDGGTVALDWPEHLELDGSEELRTVLLLVPGTTEGSQGQRIGEFAQVAEQHGWFPVIFNPRGCGGSPLTTPRVFSAADSDDVRLAVNFISRSRPWATMFSVGWGLGANLLTNYLAEERHSTPVTAAVCIDNPFDINVAVRSKSSSRWLEFDRAVTKGIVQIIAANKMLFRGGKNAFDVQGALAATSLYDFDKAISRAVHGFSTVEEFYRNSSSVSSLEKVQIPILCIQHTEDYMGTKVPIPRYAFERNAYTMLLVSQLPGIGSDSAASDRTHLISLEWLAAVEVSLLKGHHPLSRDFGSLGQPSIEDSNASVTEAVSEAKISESDPEPGPPDTQRSQQILRPDFEGQELAERMEAEDDGLESSRAAGRANGSATSKPSDETVITKAADTENGSITQSTTTSATPPQNSVSLEQEAAVKKQEDYSKRNKIVPSSAPDDGNEGSAAEALVQRKSGGESETLENERTIDTGSLEEAHDMKRSSTETEQKDGPKKGATSDSVRKKETKNSNDRDLEGESEEPKQEPKPEQELTEEEAAERGEILQVSETVMKVLDATMPGALSPSKKEEVLKAVGRGETLVTALEEAVPEDVRGKMSGAIAEIVDGQGISLKLPQLGRNLSQMKLPEGMLEGFQSEVASLSGKGDGKNANQSSPPSTPPIPKDAAKDSGPRSKEVMTDGGSQASAADKPPKSQADSNGNTSTSQSGGVGVAGAKTSNDATSEGQTPKDQNKSADAPSASPSSQAVGSDTPDAGKDASPSNTDKSPTPIPATQPKSGSSPPSDSPNSNPTPSSAQTPAPPPSSPTSQNGSPPSDSPNSNPTPSSVQTPAPPPPNPTSQNGSPPSDSPNSNPTPSSAQTPAPPPPNPTSQNGSPPTPQSPAPHNESPPPPPQDSATPSPNPAPQNASPPPAPPNPAPQNADPPPPPPSPAPPPPSAAPPSPAPPGPAPPSPAPHNESPPPPPQDSATPSPNPAPQNASPPPAPPNPAPQNADPPPPPPSPAPPPPSAAPPSPAPPGPSPPSPAPQLPSMGDAVSALTGFDDSTQMAVTNVFGVMEGALDKLEKDNPSIDPQTTDSEHRQEVIDKADAEVTKRLEKCAPGVVDDGCEVDDDEENTGDSEKKTAALDRADKEDNTQSMTGNDQGKEKGLNLKLTEPADEPADNGGIGAAASGNGTVKQSEQKDQQFQQPNDTSGGQQQTGTKSDSEGSQSTSKLTAPPSGNSPSSNGVTEVTKAQDVADNSVSQKSANEEQLKVMTRETEAGGSSSKESSAKETIAAEENKTQDNKSGLVTGLVMNALQLEVVRRLGAAGLEAVGIDLEGEAKKVAAAISGTVTAQTTGLLGNLSTELKTSEGLESDSEKLGVLNGSAVFSALNSVFGNDSVLGGLIPAGVLAGVVMAALGAVYLIVAEDEEKESAQVQAGDPDIGHQRNGSAGQKSRPKSGMADEMPEEELSSENGNGSVRTGEADGDDVMEEEVGGENGKMAGAVAATMGASAAVASQSGTNSDSRQGKPVVPEFAQKAISAVSPVVPKTEDGEVDQNRVVEVLTEIGQRGGPLLLVGKAGLLWGGLNGAMSFADRLLGFLRMSERPLPQRLLGFGGMALLLWTPILVPLLPNLLQNRVTGTPSGVAEAAAGVGLYGAVFIMIPIWGKRVRGYKRPLAAYGLEMFSRARLRMFAGGIAIGLSLVSAYYGVNWGLGYSQNTWESIVVENPAFPGAFATAVLTSWNLLTLVGQSLSMAVAVSLVEEVLFRAWLQEEISADLGYDWAVLLASLAFAVVHWSPHAIVGLWFLGVALAGARARTEGHLDLPVGIHAGILTAFSVMNTGNLVQFSSDSSAWFTGADVGNPLAGALGTGMAAALAIALYPRHPHRLSEEDYEGLRDNIEGAQGDLPDNSTGNGVADMSPSNQAGSQSQNRSQNGSPTMNESEAGSQAVNESESV